MFCVPQALGYAQTAPEATALKSFNIPAQPLAGALREFARQSQQELLFTPDVVAGKATAGVQGAYAPAQALEILLRGTGVTAAGTPNGATLLREDDHPEPAATAGQAAASPDPVALNGDETALAEGTAPDGVERRTLDTVAVTGTRIRGGGTPSPVITIGSERITEEGLTNLGEVIRSIPQNFTGGQNPGVASGGFSGGGFANQNVTGGSSLNLRGLGPDASLTLLNGRRMAYGGIVQSVDISAIPVEAVDRIEIVADGASAIYGSDAVGGVGNVILKREYEGVTIGARYGDTSDGGLATREYTVTAGAVWSSGGLIAAYKDASVDPIYVDQRSYTGHLTPPTTIYPGSDLRSGLLSAYQNLGDTAEVRLDVLRSQRDQLYFYDYYGTNRISPETTTTLVAPSIELVLGHDWVMSLGGTWGKDEHDEYHVSDDIATGVRTVIVNDCSCNESRSYEVSAEGPLFALPGGDARLAVGAGYRKNEYLQYNHTTGARATQGDESVRFGYAEVNLPLVGSDQNVFGVHRLALSAAVRGEDYDSFGSVTTPKLGLIYSPNSDFTATTSWGRSFKAPTLFQQHYATFAQLTPRSRFGGTGYADSDMVLTRGGGNLDLKAERAQTWTASLVFHPEALPGLEAELTWFKINYTDRVVQPISNFSQSLSNPVYAQFISDSPSAEEIAAIVSAATVFYNWSNAAQDLNNVGTIIYFGYTNVARQEIEGLDLSGSYRFDLGPGQMTIRGAASWLDSSQQISPAQDFYDLSGTLFNPAKVNSRVGAVWEQGGFTASAFATYTGGVTNTVAATKTASFTTFDTTLRYATGHSRGALSGVQLVLSAQNLFDRAPPLYTPVSDAEYAPPYDTTNYSPIGRFLSVSLSKSW
ncbi:TonB-dependent receptor [Pseudomonas dryadis]|uniref:TonB-dependent receptor n=2 Tax=Phytopseudomonas dryadis TaxID=2487520 RepID=A0A4Q9QVY1_9GAMM|nr:TonB-dependent receptor [Pseudomonas dryadis]